MIGFSMRASRRFILAALLLSPAQALRQKGLEEDRLANTTFCNFYQGRGGGPGGRFPILNWLRRGNCIHAATSDDDCANRLSLVLDSLDQRYSIEYNAASTVLALLPTVGALFGAPTPEIWMLSTILPVGGVLAVLLSFGGSIVPTKKELYEESLARSAVVIKSVGKGEDQDGSKGRARSEAIRDRVVKHMNCGDQLRLPQAKVGAGLVAMGVLFGAVQAGMALIAIGAVYSSWCRSQWWLHVWYFVITAFSFFDGWLNVPFAKQWQLYLTNIPYQVRVDDGDVIRQHLNTDGHESDIPGLKLALKQLSALQCGSLSITGSTATTQPRTAMLIILTTSYDKHGPPAWLTGLQFLSKAGSITIFVLGTTVFAAVTVLALPMAQMLLMLVLGAGMGSRILATTTVASLTGRVPILPLMTRSEEELYDVVQDIFALQRENSDFQIELNGHVFVQERRIGRRSPWVRCVRDAV